MQAKEGEHSQELVRQCSGESLGHVRQASGKGLGILHETYEHMPDKIYKYPRILPCISRKSPGTLSRSRPQGPVCAWRTAPMQTAGARMGRTRPPSGPHDWAAGPAALVGGGLRPGRFAICFLSVFYLFFFVAASLLFEFPFKNKG